MKFDFEGHGQPLPKTIRHLNQSILHLWSQFGYPSLNVWRVISLQAEICLKSDFEVKFDHEGQGQFPRNNRDLNQVVCHLRAKLANPS